LCVGPYKKLRRHLWYVWSPDAFTLRDVAAQFLDLFCAEVFLFSPLRPDTVFSVAALMVLGSSTSSTSFCLSQSSQVFLGPGQSFPPSADCHTSVGSGQAPPDAPTFKNNHLTSPCLVGVCGSFLAAMTCPLPPTFGRGLPCWVDILPDSSHTRSGLMGALILARASLGIFFDDGLFPPGVALLFDLVFPGGGLGNLPYASTCWYGPSFFRFFALHRRHF